MRCRLLNHASDNQLFKTCSYFKFYFSPLKDDLVDNDVGLTQGDRLRALKCRRPVRSASALGYGTTVNKPVCVTITGTPAAIPVFS